MTAACVQEFWSERDSERGRCNLDLASGGGARFPVRTGFSGAAAVLEPTFGEKKRTFPIERSHNRAGEGERNIHCNL